MTRRLLILLGAVLALAACTRNRVYDRYAHTPVAGWERNDTLVFDVPPVAAAGDYVSRLGMRISGGYPFMGLTVVVEQTVLPSRRVTADTLACQLINADGTPRGRGMGFYQYSFPVTAGHLDKGDSLHVTIRHNMRREILPGISDVGFQLSRR